MDKPANDSIADLLARFRAEHRELEQVMQALRALLAAVEPDSGLHALRWRFCFLIARHVSVEDTHAYPALRDDPRPHVAQTVRRFTGKSGSLRQEVDIWQRGWSSERIAANWDDFVVETTALLDEVDHRIACEERDLFPLLGIADSLSGARTAPRT